MADWRQNPRLGPLVLVDRPLSRPKAWALLVGPPAAFAAALLVVNARAWPASIILLVILVPAMIGIFGERLLIEQRLYERALASVILLPFRPSYVLPLGNVVAAWIHVSPRADWRDDHEHMLPASAVQRSLPWGRVVRVPGTRPRYAKVRRGVIPTVPDHPWELETGPYRPDAPTPTKMNWAFSFTDPDAAASLIADLATRERVRMGAEQ